MSTRNAIVHEAKVPRGCGLFPGLLLVFACRVYTGKKKETCLEHVRVCRRCRAAVKHWSAVAAKMRRKRERRLRLERLARR